MLDRVELQRALSVLAAGGVVACPTETFVGLLADAASPHAVARVARLKGRAERDPIGVLLPSLAAVDQIAREVPAQARALAERHWPGPLTLLVWALPELPPQLVADGKVAARVPGPSPALDLVRAFGRALTATSANRTGEPPARTSEEARAIFGDELDLIIEGECPGGLPSTVADTTVEPVRVLRQGAVTVSRAG